MTIDELPDTWQWTEADEIVKAIMKRHSLTRAQLMSNSRPERLVWARFLAYYLIFVWSRGSVNSIAQYFGKDRRGVAYGIQEVKDRMEVSPEYRAKVNAWVEFFKKTAPG